MASNFKVDEKSLAIVTRNMQIELAKITKKSRAGLIAAGLHILGVSIDKAPRDKGNLKASGMVIWDKSKPNNNFFESAEEKNNTNKFEAEIKARLASAINRFDVAVGYGASYSVYVHEDMPGHPNKHPNGGQAKFLQAAITQEQANIITIIKNHTKIK